MLISHSRCMDAFPRSSLPDYKFSLVRLCHRYGLAWSPFLEGHLLSGSDDAQICLWDICAATKGVSTLDARQIFRDHSGVVEVGF